MARQKIVYVNRSCVVSWSKGMTRLVKGDPWDGNAQLVKERPDLFDKQPPKLRGSKVERATNRPGERRGSPPPDPPKQDPPQRDEPPPADDKAEQPDVAEPSEETPAEPDVESDGDAAADQDADVPAPPPLSGAGSGAEAWRAFAAAITGASAESFAALSRGDVVDLLVAEGVIADPRGSDDGDGEGAEDEAGELAGAK